MKKNNKKNNSMIMIGLYVLQGLVAIAAAAYAIYRFLAPGLGEDFEYEAEEENSAEESEESEESEDPEASEEAEQESDEVEVSEAEEMDAEEIETEAAAEAVEE